MSVICPYCQQPAKLVGGEVIYPYCPDLAAKKFWFCRPCDAYVGTHSNSRYHKPLGRLANAELRQAKQAAHRLFDPKWMIGGMTRKGAYLWLAGQLDIPLDDCRIGQFDVGMCEQVIDICSRGSVERRRKEWKQQP